MKKLSLGLVCALLLVPLPVAFAQSPSPTPAVDAGGGYLDANYVVTLTPAEKDGTGFSVITAAQRFGVSNTQDRLVFNATLFPQKDGSFRLDYRLTNEGGGYETLASVFLRLAEPVQLVKNGKQFYNLRLDHYPAPAR